MCLGFQSKVSAKVLGALKVDPEIEHFCLDYDFVSQMVSVEVEVRSWHGGHRFVVTTGLLRQSVHKALGRTKSAVGSIHGAV